MVAGGDLARRAFDRGGPGLHLTHRAARPSLIRFSDASSRAVSSRPGAARALRSDSATRRASAAASTSGPAIERAISTPSASAASARTTSTLHSAICSRPIRATSRSSSPVASAVAPSISRYSASSCAVALPK